MEIPKKIEGFKDKLPCHWDIKLVDDGPNIIAINSVSHESYEGSIVEFNKRLRGEYGFRTE